MDARTLIQHKGGDVFSVTGDESISAFITFLHEHRIGAAVVASRGGDIVGMISERDVIRGLAQHGIAVYDWTVSDLMSRDTVLCAPGDDLKDVMCLMDKHRIRHVPVAEGAKLLGMISMRDLNKELLREAQMECDVLKEYATVAQATVSLR